MSAVTILRIEATGGAKDGTGPYNANPPAEDTASWRAREEAFKLCNAYNHPTPTFDGLYAPWSEDFCGFASWEQLNAWFHSGALEVLLSTGFYGLFEYHIDEEYVQYGGRQVLFKKAQARRRERVAECH